MESCHIIFDRLQEHIHCELYYISQKVNHNCAIRSTLMIQHSYLTRHSLHHFHQRQFRSNLCLSGRSINTESTESSQRSQSANYKLHNPSPNTSSSFNSTTNSLFLLP